MPPPVIVVSALGSECIAAVARSRQGGPRFGRDCARFVQTLERPKPVVSNPWHEQDQIRPRFGSQRGRFVQALEPPGARRVGALSEMQIRFSRAWQDGRSVVAGGERGNGD